MKTIISLFICVVCSQFLSSQIATIIPSSVSIAQTSVADTRNWSAFNNPAMLGYLEKSELDLEFENRYLLSELSTKSIQLALPSNLMNVGMSFSYFGYSLYHEMLLGLGFARNFSDKFAMGVQFNYYTAFYSATNSYNGALLPQIGLSVKLTSNFSLGFNTFNPFQTNITTQYSMKRIPSIFSAGTELLLSEDFVWRSQIDKEISSNYSFKTGFEYQMLQNISIKLGAYGSDYLVPCLGFGFRSGSLLLEINGEMHPLLGLNTIAVIKYRIAK